MGILIISFAVALLSIGIVVTLIIYISKMGKNGTSETKRKKQQISQPLKYRDKTETLSQQEIERMNQIHRVEQKYQQVQAGAQPQRMREKENYTKLLWNEGTSYKIKLTDLHHPTKVFERQIKDSVLIGRNPQEVGIVLDYDPSVSGKHCEILQHEGKFFIRDLQSYNGTYANGNKVENGTPIPGGSVLQIGGIEMRFEVR